MRGVEVKTEAKSMQGNGVQGQVAIDWPALMAFKRSYTDRVPESKTRVTSRRDHYLLRTSRFS